MYGPWREEIVDNRPGMVALVRNVLAAAISDVVAPVIRDKSQLNEAIRSAQWILCPDRVSPGLSFWECCDILGIDTETARERVAVACVIRGRDLHRLARKPIQRMQYRQRVVA